MRATPCLTNVAVLTFWTLGSSAAQTTETNHKTEIGTSVGVTMVSQSGFPTTTSLGAPGSAGPLAPLAPLLYLSVLTSPSVMVEPQVSFSSTSSGGATVTLLFLALQVGHLFRPAEKGSAYLAVSGAFQTFSPGGGGASTSGPGLGGELGYRVKIKNSLAIRVNGRYRRWFSDFKDVNEIGFGLGLGALF